MTTTPRSAFSLLEVVLALAIVALVLAAIAPALLGTMRAERQTRRILEPLAQEQLAFAMLRDDLLSAPLPNGSVAEAFAVTTASVDGRRGDTVTMFSVAQPALSPRIAKLDPELGQAMVTWQTQVAEDGRGLAWTRSRRANLLATGTAPAAEAEILLDHLAELTIETLSGTTWSMTYNSDDQGQVLPLAIRITYALLDENGEAGPKRQVVIDLPLVALDPLQSGST
jgi:prepilin-type N-terminal cleavage/methylation domain-containing protein